MDEATLYNLGRPPVGYAENVERLSRLENAFAAYLRGQGWHLRDIARLLDVRMADVKQIIGE